MHIASVTHPPQLAYKDSAHTRRSLKILVGIRLGYRPVVQVLTGSKYNGCPKLGAYRTVQGDPAVKMGASEYQAKVGRIISDLGGSTVLALCYDNDTAHKAADTTLWLDRKKLWNLLLATRSPDLDPLDYGVFGAAKKLFEQWLHIERNSWDAVCPAWIAHLESLNVDKVIGEWESRLEACIRAEGGHIEEALKAVKKEKAH